MTNPSKRTRQRWLDLTFNSHLPGFQGFSWSSVLVVCCVLVTACSKPSAEPGNAVRRQIAMQPNRIISFDARQSVTFLASLQRCTAGLAEGVSETWTVPPVLIQRLDELILDSLQNALANLHIREDTLAEAYYRQYFGLVKDGDRVILVNGIQAMFVEASDSVPGFTGRNPREPIVLCDAGPGRFFAEYSVSTNELGPIHFSQRFGGAVKP